MNVIIKTIRRVCLYIKEFYNFYKSKNLSVNAGALAYFLFSGFIPFIALLIKIASIFQIQKSSLQEFLLRFFPHQNAMQSFFTLAENRTFSIILTVFAIYSATRFYYNLIVVGEKIFSIKQKRSFIKRIFSIIYLFAILLSIALVLSLEIAGKKLLLILGINGWITNIIYYLTTTLLNALLSFALHLFSSPKKNVKLLFKGVLLTFIIWQITGFAFGFYSRIVLKGVVETLSVISTFLLYLYFLMTGLNVGLAINAKNYLSRKMF